MGRGDTVAFTGGSVGVHAAATAGHRPIACATHEGGRFVPLTWYCIRTYRSAASGSSRPHRGILAVSLFDPRTWFIRLDELTRRDEDGQGLAEYALILALIAIVAIIALIFLGKQVSGILSTV